MTEPGAPQDRPPGIDQERLWAPAVEDAGPPGSVPAEEQDPPVDAPAPPRQSRPARTVGTASGWTQSLTSTAAVPGPAGLTLADVPNRIIALVLDVLLLAVVGLVLALVLGGLFGGMTGSGATTGGPLEGTGRDLNVAAFLVVAVAQLAISFGYFAYGWVVLRATPGMRLLRLRVGDQADGHPISWDQALVRWLLLGLPATVVTFAVYVPSLAGFLLGLLAFLWLLLLLYTMAQSASKQGLHDRYARTILVRAARRDR